MSPLDPDHSKHAYLVVPTYLVKPLGLHGRHIIIMPMILSLGSSYVCKGIVGAIRE